MFASALRDCRSSFHTAVFRSVPLDSFLSPSRRPLCRVRVFEYLLGQVQREHAEVWRPLVAVSKPTRFERLGEFPYAIHYANSKGAGVLVLSLGKDWSRRVESNHRPAVYEICL